MRTQDWKLRSSEF